MPQSNQPAPLTFEMDAQTGHQLESFATENSLRSVSAAIRLILDNTDLENLALPQKEVRQFSIRVPPETRDRLSTLAKEKNASLGEIIRTAVSQFLAEPKSPRIRNGQQNLEFDD